MTSFLRRALFTLVFSVLPALASAQSGVTFNPYFSSSSVVSNGEVTAILDFQGAAASGTTGVAVTTTLPGVLTVGQSAVTNSCFGAAVSAVPGSTSVSVSAFNLGSGASCQITVPVAAGTVASNTTETVVYSWLTDAGGETAENASLTVQPGFFPASKSLSSSMATIGGRTTVSYTFGAGTSSFQQVILTETLPTGIEVASPPNAATDCLFNGTPGTATITANPGASTVELVGFVPTTAACTLDFDVTATAAGDFDLSGTVSQLSSSFVESLSVAGLPTGGIVLEKAFDEGSALPTETVQLTFTVSNKTRNDPGTALTFSDDLSSMIAGATFTGSLPANPCGAGSSLALSGGNQVLTLTGGSLAGEQFCSFTVPVTLPASVTTAGSYENQTSAISGMLDGSPYTGNQASAFLYIESSSALPPILSKSYDADTGTPGLQPSAPDTDVTVIYTIDNLNGAGMDFTDITFVDEVSPPSGMIPNTVSAVNTCGGSFSYDSFDDELTLTGGALAGNALGNAQCTITLPFSIPAGTSPGTYDSPTETISAVLSGQTLYGDAASATLTVIGGADLSLSKSFDVANAVAGSTVTATLLLESDEESPSEAVNLQVDDNLANFVTGATYAGNLGGTCGATLNGTSTSTNAIFDVASLPIGHDCTIVFDITLPTGVNGTFTNTAGGLTGTAGGEPVSTPPATADLDILPVAPLDMVREFLDQPLIPGGSFTARYTFTNTTGSDYTAVTFTDDYNLFNNATTITVLPSAGFCGAGSSATDFSAFLVFSGLSVTAGTSCTFDVTGTLPAATADGSYKLNSSAVTGSVSGSSVVLASISSDALVKSDFLELSRVYTPDPVSAGNTLSVTYTIENTLDDPVTSVSFVDSLSGFPSGTTLSGSPTSTCGGTFTGGLSFDFSGGSIAALGTCTISADLNIPSNAPVASFLSSTTAPPSGSASGLMISGISVESAFEVRSFELPMFALSYDSAFVGAGETLTGTYTITNTDASVTLSDLQFNDDYDSILSGLTLGAGSSTTCPTGSISGTGTGVLSANGLSVPPSSSCTVDVVLQIPAAAASGSVTTTSSALSSNGDVLADPVSDSFTVVPNPGFSAAFAPAPVVQGAISTLTFTLDNSGAGTSATGAGFSGTLESSLLVATPSNASTTCTGGTVTATAGTSGFSYAGGTLPSSATCTISFDVVTSTAGLKTQPIGSLTSSLGGAAGTAPTLLVSSAPIPSFSKSFDAVSIAAGGSSTMTLTINNATALVPATALSVTDTLPAGMVVATPSNAATTCTGGTLTAVAGSGTVSYSGGTVAASGSCTITVDVTLTGAGSYVNTTGALSTSLGSAGTASATLSQPGITITTPIATNDIVNGAEAPSVTVSGMTVAVANGQTVTVTATDSASGTSTQTFGVASNAYSVNLDMSGLADGAVSITAMVSDVNGTPASATPAAVTLDATPPTGQSVAFDQTLVNLANESAISFTLTGGEVGASFTYQITDTGAGSVTGGPTTITSASQTVNPLDLSGLGEGTLTLSVTLTDTNGNAAPAVTDTIEKDAVAPTVAFDSSLAGDDVVNAAEAATVTISGTSTDAEDGQSVTLSIGDGSSTVPGSALVSGGIWSTVVNLSGLSDGSLSLTADLSDVAGNPATQATANLTKDVAAPSGYSMAFDQDPVNLSNESAASLTLTGGEFGTSFAYTITSDAGGTPVTGSGTVTSAPQTLSGIDLSGLGDGTLTVTLSLTDTAGNAGGNVTDTTTKDATAPTVSFDSLLMGDDQVNGTEVAAVTISGTSTDAEDGQTVTLAISDGTTTIPSSATVNSGVWSVTLDLSALNEGALSLTADLSDVAGNPAAQASAGLTKDTIAPSGHSVSYVQSFVNIANQYNIGFDINNAEVGARFRYEVFDGSVIAPSGTGTITANPVHERRNSDHSFPGQGTLTITVILTDAAGNVAAGVTDTIIKDTVAPTLTFDNPLMGDDVINGTEAPTVTISGTSTDAEDGQPVNIIAGDGATFVLVNPTVNSGVWSTVVDLTPLADGTLNLTADVSDVAGNPATQATAILGKDTVAPSGASVSFTPSSVNGANETSVAFDFASGEVGASFVYQITSSGGGTAVTGSGTLATATDQISGLDLSGLADGTLTLTATLSDPAGNAGTAITDTITKDTVAPSLAIDNPLAGDDLVNASEAGSVTISGTSSDLPDGNAVAIVVTDSLSATVPGTANVTGGVWSVTLDLSGLADGSLSIAANATDPSGNPAIEATASLTKDTGVPTGFGVAFNPASVNAANQTAVDFSFTGAETGATFAFTVSSSAGGTPVTGTGTLGSATHQAFADLSSLPDGTLTLSVVVTDIAGNAAPAVTDTIEKDVVAPTLAFDGPFAGDDVVNAAEESAVTIDGTSTDLPDGHVITVQVSDGTATVSGTATVGSNAWSATFDLSGLADGPLTLSASTTDPAGNPAVPATDTLTKDTAAPTGFTVAFAQTAVNAANETASGFGFTDGETGASFAYTITSSGGGTAVTGTGTISSATHAVSGLDLSGLADGTLTLSVVVTDTAGNASTASTDTVEKDVVAPTLAFDRPISGDDVVNAAEAGAQSVMGTSSGLPDGQTVTVAASDGTATVSGTTTVSGGAWTVVLDLSGLADGTINLTADASDVAGNPAAQAAATVTKDATAPSGYTVLFDQDPINLATAGAASFTFAGAEVGAMFNYTITSDAGGTPVSSSGTIASADQQVSAIDLTGLNDGTLTLSVTLTDLAGNTGAAATDDATKDVAVPGVAFDSPLLDDDVVNASEASSATISGTATDVEDGQSVTLAVSDGSATATGSATVSGGIWSTAMDLSALADGALSLTADLDDAAGNPAPQATASLSKDATAPSGYGVSFDQDPVNLSNVSAVSFSFSGAEVGASFVYAISSDSGGTAMTGSGTISSATEQVSGLDVSGLGDGTLTVTVALTDTAGNAGIRASGTATKDVIQPTVTLTVPTEAQSDPFEVTVSFSEPVTGFALASLDIDNGTASVLNGSGDTYTFTLTPDHDGDITITVLAAAAQDGQGNDSVVSDPVMATADLTGTPDPAPLPDSDGDGVPDANETGDRDGDGIPDASDYDPQGYFYCEDDGRILAGGGITVSGPSGSNSSIGLANDINIVRDGSTGEFQWFATRPGTYTVTYSYPASEGLPSTARLSSGTLDVTTILPSNPGVLGSTEDGSTGFLADASASVFYDTFVIEPGDPDVLANNVPMTQCAENPVTASLGQNGAEANGGTPTDVTFVIAQDRLSALPTVVTYTMGGTATGGTDYTAPSGTATIPVGDTSVVVTVPVLEDGLIEGSESVSLTLAGVTSGDTVTMLSTTASDLTATASILDDDNAVIAVTDVDLTTSENGDDDATMSFVLLGQPSSNVTLSFAGDSQCKVMPATLTFTSANYTSPQALTIRAIDDEDVEGTHSCQPTVTVSSADSRYDAYALALSTVTVTDDLVDQIRDPLTEILKDDLEQTVRTQQRHFSRIAKGALSRLKEGQSGLECGTISAPDVDGRLTIQDGTGSSDGKFGWDVYNCYTMRREILDGSFSLNWSADKGTQAMLQFSRQSEKFLSESALHGFFWGGYYSRNLVDGPADGVINGFGLNGGVYGARDLGDGLFMDYYASAAIGMHRYDLTFDANPADITATGDYRYAAVFGGVALSGTREYETFTLTPRVGLDLAHAWVSDASVTAKQLGQTDTGRIELPDFSGGRLFAEVEFAGIGSKEGAAAFGEMMTEMSFTPRVACEFSSYGDGADCSAGINISVMMTKPSKHLSYGFELDYERLDDLNRLTLDFTRERKFARGQGAVVTRLAMPSPEEVTLEHGVSLDF
ncbi:Ig-like domain-containing protein [Pacificoceanicola onchidii]|uniref:DUF7933 domain-containing protein n=1 Tax=Pacificoceanicola onchidii TaxID=2562685 RepID=UPI0010A55F82|nr:Ig-like domain-containing protein [Pacificoceanicola onchidii]